MADEFPAMRALAAKLLAAEAIPCSVVAQSNLPAVLSAYSAIVLYVHGDLSEKVETAAIDYVNQGGKLLALHHSISSGKRRNLHWFEFLGVSLPQGPVDEGGYKWIEPASLQLVCLADDHFIATNKVRYPAFVDWDGPGPSRRPSLTFPDSEVYLNHKLLGPRKLLFGLRYQDPRSGKTYCQALAGWVRSSGRGSVIYLMPGHSLKDFDVPAYFQIVANALVWNP